MRSFWQADFRQINHSVCNKLFFYIHSSSWYARENMGSWGIFLCVDVLYFYLSTDKTLPELCHSIMAFVRGCSRSDCHTLINTWYSIFFNAKKQLKYIFVVNLNVQSFHVLWVKSCPISFWTHRPWWPSVHTYPWRTQQQCWSLVPNVLGSFVGMKPRSCARDNRHLASSVRKRKWFTYIYNHGSYLSWKIWDLSGNYPEGKPPNSFSRGLHWNFRLSFTQL